MSATLPTPSSPSAAEIVESGAAPAGAGVALDRGVFIDVYLKTCMLGIFAIGDIARRPDVPFRSQHYNVPINGDECNSIDSALLPPAEPYWSFVPSTLLTSENEPSSAVLTVRMQMELCFIRTREK